MRTHYTPDSMGAAPLATVTPEITCAGAKGVDMKRVLPYTVTLLIGALTMFPALGMLKTEVSEQKQQINKLQQDLSYCDNELRRDDTIFMSVFGSDWRRDKPMYRTPVTVTAYSSRVEETDDTPHLTADMTFVRVGIIAVSRDILDELGLTMGQRVLLTGYGVFEVHDKMNKRYRRRVDIWMPDHLAANLHGVQQSQMMWFGKGGEG